MLKPILLLLAVTALLVPVSAIVLAPDVPGNPPPNAVPDKSFLLIASEADVVIDDGVVFRAFVFNGTSPGPLIVVEEGEIVEIVVKNVGHYTHGLSIHAANTQTSKFVGNIAPGSEAKLIFKADFPGVYMYHCAPGGHGILTHTLAGMYGMIVVEPKKGSYLLEKQLNREPDIKVYLVQHEVYLNGRDFFDAKAAYVMFNGKVFRYVTEPIAARPGDYIRFYFLNVGPNHVSSFHAVGGVWEYVYHGGNPENVAVGLQTVTIGPTDSYVIEWRVPAEGNFLIVSHAFGTQAIKGAVGIIASSVNATPQPIIYPHGLTAQPPAKPKRIVAPFEPTSIDESKTFLPGEDVAIQIVGNSYYPKTARVPVGSTVTWVNEDVLSIGSGEITGQHNVAVVDGPALFASPLLKNAEQFRFKIEKPGTYQYICGIHPYMKGTLIAYTASATPQTAAGIGFTVDLTVLAVFIGGLGALSLLVYVGEKAAKKP